MCRCPLAALRTFDRFRGRSQQPASLPQRASQRARREACALSLQQRDDPVDRQPQPELGHHQPGDEPGGEPAPWDRTGRRRGGNHTGRLGTVAAPPPRQPPMHHPAHHHLPVKLLAAFLTERDIALPARPTNQLLRIEVMDTLNARQMRVVATAMTPAARLLPPTPPTPPTAAVNTLPRSAIARSGALATPSLLATSGGVLVTRVVVARALTRPRAVRRPSTR